MKPKLILALVLSGMAAVAIIIFYNRCLKVPAAEQICAAAMAGDLDGLKKQEAMGVSLNYQDHHARDWTPLTCAIFHQQTNIVQYLLTRNLNLDLQDTSGKTALMWAIEMDDTNAVRLLLEKGADVSIKTKYGDAFMCANVESGDARAHRELYLEWLNAFKDKNKSSNKP